MSCCSIPGGKRLITVFGGPLDGLHAWVPDLILREGVIVVGPPGWHGVDLSRRHRYVVLPGQGKLVHAEVVGV